MANRFPSTVGNTALLVEPSYPTSLPPIGLLKISTYLKDRGVRVAYVRGQAGVSMEPGSIYVTSLFTYFWQEVVEDASYYAQQFPNARLFIGGIYASLMPEHVTKHLGVIPMTGSFEEVDECPPDYSMMPPEVFKLTSHIFTSRGCPNACGFCGTRAIEPDLRVIRSWKDHLNPLWKKAVLHDNNILAHGDAHFEEVLSTLKEWRIRFLFDNGLDCRLFERRHATSLAASTISEVRFAFDSPNQDGEVQQAIELCKAAGIPTWKIKVFILYNYRDDLEDALYRAGEVHRLGASPWAMRYMPLRWLNPERQYVGPHWLPEDLFSFNSYVNRYGIMRKYSYEEWKSKRSVRSGRNFERHTASH